MDVSQVKAWDCGSGRAVAVNPEPGYEWWNSHHDKEDWES